ncbi:MAG: purine-nucleoside phosphorylase [Candidatus Marinimicrobia bacterium]|jgi:purine-nucleoside phosphorylase|nr:purine-nucleoside phosphorylase [Candidatus Neomarinimicrobiota bacterium]MBT3631299.1 purine-nucleoside phosphorylase [Candidatus Neomarinimicrobiota bacterium]MBT3824298.1 purine-nucleoside phosphorylase [Candidatus Neomarinimicrobiota bacterium]MBT4129437.1 purine-nucleoside phosphorylase [Candidatus Neomarinimicrobiota bacterium]MBT4295428.1 purine-nucleoside phosphorylase [Candidatus Neomarinimicrobiota bacterium]
MPKKHNDMISKAVAAIHKHGEFKAEIALVLGSGLGNFVDALSNTSSISFADIPGFPVSTVEGHSGELVHGFLGDVPVLVNSGRVHFYEGYTLDQVIYPIQILHALGARTIVLTNAAGSIREDYAPGDLMLITKLINQTGHSVYPVDTEPENVFVTEHLDMVKQVAQRVSVPLKTGSYAGLNGPSYETPAEIRFLRLKQADAVGMSTVHESMAAFQIDMNVLGISCLTNYAAGILDQPLNHAEVMETGIRVREDFATLLGELVREISQYKF